MTPRKKKATNEEVARIKDLQPDPHNFRKHTAENIGMLVDSLQETGAGRSILIDENKQIIAGNGVVEAAPAAGIEKVRIIHAEPNELIAVQRTGLTPLQKKRMALFDNRTQELSSWEQQALAEEKDPSVFKGIFSDEEVDELKQGWKEDAAGESDKDVPGMELEPYEHYDYIVVLFRNVLDFQQAIEKFGLGTRQIVRRNAGQKIGFGRVVEGEKLLEIINDVSRETR